MLLGRNCVKWLLQEYGCWRRRDDDNDVDGNDDGVIIARLTIHFQCVGRRGGGSTTAQGEEGGAVQQRGRLPQKRKDKDGHADNQE